LREHRGDGHVAALLGAGLDGCDAHVTLVGDGEVPASILQPNRGWSDDAWNRSIYKLRRLGYVDEDGRNTPAGKELRRHVEARTDELAMEPWDHLGHDETRHMLDLLRPARDLVVTNGGIPFPNPMGLTETQVRT
jgi:hypothetical protein